MIEEIIFLIIPNLAVELIIGCDSFSSWKAIIDFGKNNLRLCDRNKVETVTFVNEEENIRINELATQNNMLEETFFVESINISRMEVMRVKPIVCSDIETNPCVMERGCDTCVENAIESNARWIDPKQDGYIEECIRLCNIKTCREISFEETMRQKIAENENLNPEAKNKLLGVVMKNRKVFSDKLGKCKSYIHKFEVTDTSPFNHKCRTIPTALVEKVDDAIRQMLEDGVIGKSHRKYINPLCMVMKKDGAVRLTIDARTLNKRCIPNHFRTENIDRLLERVNGASYFSIIDLSSSFWQVELNEECKDYTAFLHNGKQYRFNRAPFGHNSSNAALLRALDIFGN